MGTAAGDGAAGAPRPGHGYDYDLVVIGGGSGGLACSKEAARLGSKVACLDFVSPTPLGTQWGLGGTCVNVGCIPKKLFHQASLLGETFSDAREIGWKLSCEGHDWSKMVQAVQDYIGSLNWGYRVALRDNSVSYINARGRFVGPHAVECTDRRGKVHTITSEYFVVAVGGRPRYLGVPGDKELCLTSDDIFSWPTPPGKTLIVGAGYIAMETAGFLTSLGYDVTVMARSIFLRDFDQEIAEHIVSYMQRRGTKTIRSSVPVRFERAEEGKIEVTYKKLETGEELTEVFDTVMLAVRREAEVKELGLDKAGVLVSEESGKIVTNGHEQTNVSNIYAIGDVVEQRQELTPVAIKAGVLLAKRLFGGSKIAMDYNTVPTTVFTPLEYGCVGLSEEVAADTYGAENIEVYHSYFKPLEWQVNHEAKDGVMHREDNVCYSKLITNLLDNERVLGLHVVSPNAGEVTQGFAVALKCKATKADFDATVGIHPTIAEEFTVMNTSKRSGKSALKTGC
eukprot:SM000207S06195  [mRNA]  locus=s207:180141:183542:- [translate_table: standard]